MNWLEKKILLHILKTQLEKHAPLPTGIDVTSRIGKEELNFCFDCLPIPSNKFDKRRRRSARHLA